VQARRTLGTLRRVASLKDHLPRHVDWRGTTADLVVKDQATCGSCWAFSATGTMQGVWALATGRVGGAADDAGESLLRHYVPEVQEVRAA
jgi:C1A family cysteine protease